jgi:hypothetical protein
VKVRRCDYSNKNKRSGFQNSAKELKDEGFQDTGPTGKTYIKIIKTACIQLPKVLK